MKSDTQKGFSTLVDIIESRLGGGSNVVWWGPVVGSDEDPSPDLSIPEMGLEIVSDEIPPR